MAFYAHLVNTIVGPLRLQLPFLPVVDGFLHPESMFHPKPRFLVCCNEIVYMNGPSRTMKYIVC